MLENITGIHVTLDHVVKPNSGALLGVVVCFRARGPHCRIGVSGKGIMGKSARYAPEFREQAVHNVIDTSRPIAQVAKELGLVEQTLGSWVRKYREQHAGELDRQELAEPERAELKRLRKENRELKLEQEFLKKAAAFFAKESR